MKIEAKPIIEMSDAKEAGAKEFPGSAVARKTLPENPAVRKVAQQFESIFINQMVGAMRKTVSKDSFVPESHAEKVYQGMLDSEYSQRMAESGQFGLSQLIYEHLLRTR